MKKIILILLLIIPVVVTAMAYMLAGFVGRSLTIVPIAGISVDYAAAASRNVIPLVPNENVYQITSANVNSSIDLTSFISVQPAGARFTHLHFDVVYLDSGEVSTAVYVNHETGIMRMVERTSEWVEVRVGDGVRTFMTIWVLEVV